MARLHIFNPDSDYALANGSQWFTPPAPVVELRRRLALLPAIYATPSEDAILLLDTPMCAVESLEHFQTAQSKHLEIITVADLAKKSLHFGNMTVEPWGWNMAMLRFVTNRIGRTPGLPSEDDMIRLRELSHRRTTIAFMEWLRRNTGIVKPDIETPQEISSPEDALSAFNTDRNRYFKSPWSSSGRGILLTDDLEAKHVEPWVKGIIARQGSVLMEKAYNRRLDFASEWICREGDAHFIGWSVFDVSRRGKYHGQVSGSQAKLSHIIKESSGQDPDSIAEAQREAILTLIAPYYNGPLGIDMLTTDNGSVNPCVELNLRHTMGMLNLL